MTVGSAAVGVRSPSGPRDEPDTEASRLPAWYPAHAVIGVWLLLTAPLLAVPVPPVAPRLMLLTLHLVGAALLLGQPLNPARLPGSERGWSHGRLLLPFLLAPLFYWETPTLAAALHGGGAYDTIVLHWEAVLFRGQPSQTFAARFPWLWLSEPLHAAYLSYYLIVVGPAAALYALGRRAAFQRVVFTLVLVILVHQAVFIAFPVLGPRYLFPAPSGPLEGGVLYQLTHRILEGGSSPGTAFPSSHVGISVAVTFAMFRERSRAAPWLALVTAAMAVATVYGGFHYAVDAVAGVVLGLAVGATAPWLHRRLRARPLFTRTDNGSI